MSSSSDISATAPPLLSKSFLSSDSRLPLVVEPNGVQDFDVRLDGLRAWVHAYLPRFGGMLFRGFRVDSTEAFERMVKRVTPDLLGYEFRSTPRSHVADRIYTSTEYPAHQHIPLHNENAYTTEWPMKIWFCCVVAAQEGGATPLADSREVFNRIPAKIRNRFIEKKVMYVRNYGNGLDLPWEKVFNTSDRGEVDRFCRRAGIHHEWKKDGELRTRHVCQAMAVHPQTGEAVWFNQAHLFHVSNLEPGVRASLLEVVSEEDLPRQTYYGDGSAIEDSILDEIREVYRSGAVEFPWQAGDVMLLDNMLAAHGRAPFRGPRKVLVAMAEPCSAAVVGQSV
jgi:alpha-ketoglutarate-dependent taurine dioxygenase